MPNIPKITIVMPCYNGIKYIQQAVDSVLAQTIGDWELIISDDGSQDGTVEYLKALADKRIKIFFQERNSGIFPNLNRLFAAASATITQILCQDDYLLGSDSLQKTLQSWRDLPSEAAFLRCNHSRDGTSPLIRLERSVLPKIVSQRKSDLYFFIFGCIPGNLSNVSLRTEIVERMGWFRSDLPYAGDFEFWARVGRVYPWALSDVRTVYVRTHSEQASVTLNKRGELLPQLNEVIQKLYDRLRDQGYRPFELRLMATINYGVRQMDSGLKSGLTGQGWGYLKLVDKVFLASTHFLGWWTSWILYVVSFRGRIFAPSIGRYLTKRSTSIFART